MTRRQTAPREWLIVPALDQTAFRAIAQVRRGSGVFVIAEAGGRSLRQLRLLAAARGLTVALERRGDAARVHNVAELRGALLRRVPLILLSPIFPTTSHPDWQPIRRMRAASLARLANRRLLALGGLDANRYAKIARLGFTGWAGISAFRT